MSKFELNKGDQFIVAGDGSGSMAEKDCPGEISRFDYMIETMIAFIAEAAKWDPDGVSFYAFGSTLQQFRDVQSVDELKRTIGMLRPRGRTATHLAIQAAYEEHKEKGSAKTFLMIFTDGEPSEPELTKQAVIDITHDIKDETEFRISILTVGKQSPELQAWLADLDDNLTGAKYDIVDISRLEDVDFEGAVANAIDG